MNRATEEAFSDMGPIVEAYFEHWSSLIDNGFSDEVVASAKDTDVPGRDRIERANLFSADVDPVWNQITQLIGDQAEQIRLQLVTND